MSCSAGMCMLPPHKGEVEVQEVNLLDCVSKLSYFWQMNELLRRLSKATGCSLFRENEIVCASFSRITSLGLKILT